MSSEFFIFAEDAVLAVVNAQQYKTFVDNDWTLSQLLSHFVEEMNNNHLVIWQTDNVGGADWRVAFLNSSSGKTAYREFSKSIAVTSGELYLVSYTDLTMAAQFEEEKLPSEENASLCYKLPSGKYNLLVRQMFNPDSMGDLGDDEVAFEIVVSPAISDEEEKVNAVFWWKPELGA